MSLLKQCDYYGKLSRQFPIAPIRVVYSASGTIPAACVVWKSDAIIDNSLYWAAAESSEEAYYLCGILNSDALRVGVQGYQSQGQWGARHFHKYVFNLPIPHFDKNDVLHNRLADAAKKAEEVANKVREKEDEYFTRKRIRSALAKHGIAAELERLATKLLSGA